MTNVECRIRGARARWSSGLFSLVIGHWKLVILLSLCHSLFVISVTAHESPIDHVDRTLRMRVDGNILLLTYRLRLTQRAALLQLRAMDEDNNGRVNDDERERFFDKFAIRLAKQLRVELDGKVFWFQPRGRVQLNPDFSQTVVFVAEIGELAKGKHSGLLKDFHSRSYPGSFVFLQQRAPENERAIVEAHSQPVGSRHTGMLSIRFDVRVK